MHDEVYAYLAGVLVALAVISLVAAGYAAGNHYGKPESVEHKALRAVKFCGDRHGVESLAREGDYGIRVVCRDGGAASFR